MVRSSPVALLSLLSIVAATGAGQTQDGRVNVPLALAEGQGCFITPEGAGLWSSLWDADTQYFEAEDAANLTFQEGHGALEDAECGGEACVARVVNADFPLTITEAGSYRIWARTFLPVAGSWGHEQSMDGGARRMIRESDARIFGAWYWSPLGEYSLTRGEHTFTLHGWLGGAKLDAVIFSADPDFDPTSLRGTPAGPDATRGTVTTRPLVPSAVARWGLLTADADRNGGLVAVQASLDGGATWIAAHTLPQGAVQGDGSDALLARFTLTAAPDGASPLLRGAQAAFTLSEDAEVTLETAAWRMAVARHTGALAGMLYRPLNLAVTPPHLQQPLVAVVMREPGATEQTVIPPDEIEFEGLTEGPGRLTLDFSALDKQLRLRVILTAAHPLAEWTLELTNNSPLEVIRIDFPLVGNAAIGDWGDDRFVLPQTGGRIIDRPATADREWSATYLGGGSMSFIELCDAQAGLMVHMTDRALTTTEMGFAPAAGGRGADLFMRTHTLVAPGRTVRREYRVGPHPGDWHWAADRYREWALAWMRLPENPEWLRWCDGWVGAMSVPFAHMPGLLGQARHHGIEYLQYWGQMADGMDQCCGNFYWPAPALGGAEGFRDGIAAVHAAGGRVTAYMNCQTWTRDAPINDSLRMTPKSELPQEALDLIHPLQWFERNRLYQMDGSALGYYASTLGWYIMCPASTGFQEHLRFWIAEMYARRFGIDGVYIDQTGATAAKPCYNREHGHDDIGAWGMGNVEMLRSSLAAARESNPDFIIAIEGCGDALGQYANLHLISGLCTHPEVYHYTFPEHILVSGMSNASHLSAEQRVTRAFLNGDRFDSRVESTDFVSAAKLRRRIKQWLYPARFMDTLGLSVSEPNVLARWNLCDSASERALVLTFDNEQQIERATCALAVPDGWERPDRVYVFDREGRIRAEEPQVADGALSLQVSSSTISAALVSYAIAPAHAVDVVQEVLHAGASSDTLVLNAVNLAAEPVVATVTPRVQPPLSCPGGAIEIAIPARGTARAELPIAGVGELQLPALVALDVTWPGGGRQSLAELRPLVLNAGLSADEDGDGTPDYWVASGSKSGSFARGMEDGGAWIQGEEGQTLFLRQMVPVEPARQYYFAAEIRRSGGAGKVYAAVVEHIGERGLQVHGIGDDPEAPADTWQRFETTFTTVPEFRTVAIYLYNNDSTRRAWFRNVELRATGQ